MEGVAGGVRILLRDTLISPQFVGGADLSRVHLSPLRLTHFFFFSRRTASAGQFLSTRYARHCCFSVAWYTGCVVSPVHHVRPTSTTTGRLT